MTRNPAGARRKDGPSKNHRQVNSVDYLRMQHGLREQHEAEKRKKSGSSG